MVSTGILFQTVTDCINMDLSIPVRFLKYPVFVFSIVNFEQWDKPLSGFEKPNFSTLSSERLWHVYVSPRFLTVVDCLPQPGDVPSNMAAGPRGS